MRASYFCPDVCLSVCKLICIGKIQVAIFFLTKGDIVLMAFKFPLHIINEVVWLECFGDLYLKRKHSFDSIQIALAYNKWDSLIRMFWGVILHLTFYHSYWGLESGDSQFLTPYWREPASAPDHFLRQLRAYSHLPKILLIKCIKTVILWVNWLQLVLQYFCISHFCH